MSRRGLTHEPGYDGGPFFSHDGKRIVYRRDSYADEAGLARYRELSREASLPTASFAPYVHPDGRRIIFASNHPDPRSRNCDLYLIRDDGTGLERITSEPAFDGFPMFSPDGRQLVFASNRGARVPGETNLFLVDWVE
jgi:Tol biopolymer transport system component